MGRSIAIKLAILLVVAALVYSVFWFFKVGQVEKQIKEFVGKNASYISAGEIAVSGFPLAQKITIKNLKFSIPTAALDNNQVLVPHLEAKTGILSSDYTIALLEPVTVQDADGNVLSVEFGKDPEITLSMLDGNISKFHYQDSGYRIIGPDKAVAYSASNSMFLVKSTVEAEKTTNTISVAIKEIEGFDAISLYKNVLEKKVVDGIKTGEITLGNNSAPAVTDPAAQAAAAAPAPAVTPAPQATLAATTSTTTPATAANPATTTTTTTTALATPSAPVTAAATTPAPAQDSASAATPAATAPADSATAPAPVPATIADTSIVKSDFVLEMEYILTPIQSEGQQAANTPPDPTQIQEAPSQHSKLAKIIVLEFSNPLYKITVSGEMSSLPDDNMPSGGVTVKVEKVSNLVSQVAANFSQMADKIKPLGEVKPAETKPDELQPAADLLSGTASAPIEDPYRIFLTRIVSNLPAVTKEIATKNAVSKDEIAQFDVRREKNLDFLVNETPIREILGKF